MTDKLIVSRADIEDKVHDIIDQIALENSLVLEVQPFIDYLELDKAPSVEDVGRVQVDGNVEWRKGYEDLPAGTSLYTSPPQPELEKRIAELDKARELLNLAKLYVLCSGVGQSDLNAIHAFLAKDK